MREWIIIIVMVFVSMVGIAVFFDSPTEGLSNYSEYKSLFDSEEVKSLAVKYGVSSIEVEPYFKSACITMDSDAISKSSKLCARYGFIPGNSISMKSAHKLYATFTDEGEVESLYLDVDLFGWEQERVIQLVTVQLLSSLQQVDQRAQAVNNWENAVKDKSLGEF